MWLPDARNHQNALRGYAVMVGHGFGYDRFAQHSLGTMVRVLAWERQKASPDFRSYKGNTEMIAKQDAYKEIGYNIAGMTSALPARTEVLVHSSRRDNMVFPAIAMPGMCCSS